MYKLNYSERSSEEGGECMSGERIIAYVLLNVMGGKEYEVVEKIKNIEGVTEVLVVYGEYDIVARIVANNMKTLDRTVTRIRETEGVLRSITLLGLA